MAAAGLCTIVSAGVLLSWIALRKEGWHGPNLALLSLGLGPGIGLGIASFQLFFWRWAGFRMPGPISFLALGTGVALLVMRAKKVVDSGNEQESPEGSLIISIVAHLVLILSIASVLNAYLAISRAWPGGIWDAVGIYNVRARLFYERYDDFPDVLKQVSAASHPNYPLLLPGAIAALDSFLGHYSDSAPRVVGLAFVVATGLLTYSVLRYQVGSAIAAAVAATVWSAPIFWVVGLGQMADVPAAYYLFGGTAVLSSQFADASRPRLPAYIGGFFIACLMWTKNEGVITGGLVLILFGAMQLRRWLSSPAVAMRITSQVLIGIAPGILALVLLKRDWAPSSGLDVFFSHNWMTRIAASTRWWIPIRELWFRLVAHTDGWWKIEWSFVWSVVLGGLIAAAITRYRGSRPSTRFWVVIVILSMVCWIPIYAVTPYDQMWHITTSMDRLFLQIFPVALVAITLTLAEDRALSSLTMQAGATLPD